MYSEGRSRMLKVMKDMIPSDTLAYYSTPYPCTLPTTAVVEDSGSSKHHDKKSHHHHKEKHGHNTKKEKESSIEDGGDEDGILDFFRSSIHLVPTQRKSLIQLLSMKCFRTIAPSLMAVFQVSFSFIFACVLFVFNVIYDCDH